MPQSLARAIDILVEGPRETADSTVLDGLRDSLDCLVIALAGDGKTGLDDVDAHTLERLGDAQFFILRHGGSGALFSITKGCIEYDKFVGVHDLLRMMLRF